MHSSKNKDYARAYQEATKKTFESIKSLNYQYFEPQNNVVIENTQTEIIIEEIESIDEEKLEVIDDVKGDKIVNQTPDLLYAQEITNGYQLVDSTPKLVYIIQATSLKNVYFIKDKKGIIFEQNGKWFIEYYFNNDLIKRELIIKF